MSLHSKYGGSKASQWMNCAGSVANQAVLASTTEPSEFAEEGTQAHKVAELIYQDWQPPKGVNREMLVYARQYRAGLKARDALYGGISFTEKRLVDPGNREVFGTVDHLLVSADTLIVTDYKYGAGEYVPIKDNAQLLYYGLLALRALGIEPPKRVILSIFQPRSERGGWRNWTIGPEKLYEFGHQMNLAIDAVEKGKVETKAGPWCRWCTAKVKCRAFADMHLKTVRKVKDGIYTLSTDEIAEILDSKASINQWLKAVDVYVKSVVSLTKEPFHGYIVQPKLGRTEWLDPLAIENNFPPEDNPELYRMELRTPKQVLDLRPDLAEVLDKAYKQTQYQTLVKLSDPD